MSSPSTNDGPVSAVEEAATVRRLMNQDLSVNDMWYCVAMDWWSQWKEYVGYDSGEICGQMSALSLAAAAPETGAGGVGSKESSPAMRSPSYTGQPGRIKNEQLIGDSANEMVKNITLDTHYVIVPEPVWKQIHAYYGGGPELGRKVVALGTSRQLKVELYPSKFQVIRADTDGNPIQNIDENDFSNENSGNYQCLYFNSDNSMADLLQQTCEAFSTYRISSRLWVSQTLDDENWRLIGKSETINDLCDGGVEACLMLEVKGKETKAFPRDRAVVKSTWREEIKVGDSMDAQDHAESKWYESIVVERKENIVRLHFLGWETRFDEDFNIATEPARLMPLNTKVKFWRDFRVNDDIEMRNWKDMSSRTGGFDWQLVRIDSLDRTDKTLNVYFKRDKRRTKYTVPFDSEEICWRGCHVNRGGYRSKAIGGGDTAGKPKGGPGVVGLTNLGNTCFMNSMLQCLSNCEPLTEHFLSGEFEETLNLDNPLGMGGRLAECYAGLLQRMWSNETVVCRPSEVKKLIGERAPHFQGYQQQDSSEFMNFLLDGIHEDLNKVPSPKPYVEVKEADGRPDSVVANERWNGFLQRNDSFVVDKFFGLSRSEVRCDAEECNRVSVTFDPERAFMLPLPAVRTILIKITMVYADPHKPVTRYGVTVQKTGTVLDVRNWLEKATGVPGEQLFLAKIQCAKILNMVKSTEKVKVLTDYFDYYAYEVLSEEEIQKTVELTIAEGKNENEMKNEEKMMDPATDPAVIKDSNGYWIGQKCRCQWKSTRGAFYNCEITATLDEETGTYIVDFEDGDHDGRVELERLSSESWLVDKKGRTTTYTGYRVSDQLGEGFHTDDPNGRITVEVLHRVANTTNSYYSNTPQKEIIQWPLVLSMKKNIKCDELHNLVWKNIERFVTPETEWNRFNLPYCIRIDDQHSCKRTTKDPIQDLANVDVNLEEMQSIVIDWSPEGVKTGFDKTFFEKREDHESMPSRNGAKDGSKKGLSLDTCFHEMAKEEQLGENDKWHCSECRKAGREPFRRAFKKMTVYKTGEVLVLHLKRFIFEAGFNASFVHREKIDRTIGRFFGFLVMFVFW